METTKKSLIFPKKYIFPSLFHVSLDRKGILTILPKVFFAQILQQAPYIKDFKELFSSKSFSKRVRAVLTGSPKPLFSKSYIKSSLKVRKERVISEFSMRVFFSICSSVHIELSSEKNAESFSLKVLQNFCSKPENQNKRLIFQKRVAKNVLLDT